MVGKTNGLGNSYVYSATSGFVSPEDVPVTWMDDYSNVTHDFLSWFMCGFIYGVSSICSTVLLLIGAFCRSKILVNVANGMKLVLFICYLAFLISG